VLKKFFSYTAAEGLSKALNWLSIALLPLVLSPKEYGIVGLLVAIEGVVSTITLIGQEKAIFRFHNPKSFNVLKYSFQLVTLFLILIMLISGGVYLLKKELFNIPIFPHLIVFLVSILFYNQARLLMSFSRITENAAMFWKTRALYQIIKIVAVFILAYWFKSGLSYIYGCFAAGFIFFIIYARLIYSNYKPLQSLVKFDKNTILLLGFGVPLIFHAMSGNILSYADRFFVNGFLDSKQLGIYTFVYSLGSSIFFFYGTVASYFEPLTYRHHDNKAAYQTILKFYLVFVLICAGVLAFSIKCSFEPIILKYVSKDYILGINCLGYVLAAHLIIPFYTVANFELAVINKTKFIATSTVLSAMVNIGLNFLFIPKMGIVGGAISTFCTYLFLALITNLWSRIKAGWDTVYLRFIFLMFLFVNGLLFLMTYFNNRMPAQILVFATGIIILSVLLFSLLKKLKAVFAVQPVKEVVA
jgi:O-antigen/teichoic acid export membrane protein